jgi:Rps23 Pro-64 3,4-dihydroxylase Tpa1-like proline 4-hydroxylase
MIYTIPNFITQEDNKIIVNNLSQYYKKHEHPFGDISAQNDFATNTYSALGLPINSEPINQWDELHPFMAYANDETSKQALKLFFDISQRVRKQVENEYGYPFKVINSLLNKMGEGTWNPTHTDDQPGYDDPVFTCLIYLSEYGVDYTGGELYFHTEDLLIKPQQNSLVFFEGTVSRPHEVYKITSGNRETIIIWLTKA